MNKLTTIQKYSAFYQKFYAIFSHMYAELTLNIIFTRKFPIELFFNANFMVSNEKNKAKLRNN